VDHVLSEDVIDASTGEVIASAGDVVTFDMANEIQDAAVPFVFITVEDRVVKVLSNMTVDISKYVDIDKKKYDLYDRVYYPVLSELMEAYEGAELIEQIGKNSHRI
jgi:DNA-directed RNA polymerase subunit beta